MPYRNLENYLFHPLCSSDAWVGSLGYLTCMTCMTVRTDVLEGTETLSLQQFFLLHVDLGLSGSGSKLT